MNYISHDYIATVVGVKLKSETGQVRSNHYFRPKLIQATSLNLNLFLITLIKRLV